MNIHENIYYSPEFQAFRDSLEFIFDEKYLTGIEERSLDLGYRMEYCDHLYVNTDLSTMSYTNCGRLRLYSPENEMIFTAKIYDDSNCLNMAKVISHADGKKYFIYKEHTYGCSILCIDTMEQMHYIPRGESRRSSPVGESYITGEFFYDPSSSVAAVSCMWWGGCPEIALIDMSDPMKEPVKFTVLCDFIDPKHTEYRSLEFKAWRNGRLIIGTDKNEELSFTSDILKRFLMISCGK